jgi:hypothetical protein
MENPNSEVLTQRAPEADGQQRDQDDDKQDEAPDYDSPQLSTSMLNLEENDRAPAQQQATPAYTWKTCKFGDGWGMVRMMAVADPNMLVSDPRGLAWFALLTVKCRDIPRLMREGFFWSADNIIPEQGRMAEPSCPQWARHFGLVHARVWGLADKPKGSEGGDAVPLWVAQLEVCSGSVELLGRFAVRNLSREMVSEGFAWNADRQLVYACYHTHPDYSFNCIYDDMPLRGWWPVAGRASSRVAGSGPTGASSEPCYPPVPWEPRGPGDQPDGNLSPTNFQPATRQYEHGRPACQCGVSQLASADRPLGQPHPLVTRGCAIL